MAQVKRAVRGEDWPGLLQCLHGSWPEFTVHRVVLWQSVLGSTGPSYTPLHEEHLW